MVGRTEHEPTTDDEIDVAWRREGIRGANSGLQDLSASELQICFGVPGGGFSGENQCPTGEQFVAAAATALAHPESVQTEPRWDTCDLLRAAIGDENGNYRRSSQVNILDECAEDKAAASLFFDYGTPGVDSGQVKWTKDVVGNTTTWVWERADACTVDEPDMPE